MAYISKADVLYKGRVQLRLSNDLLHQLVDNAIQRSILEATLAGLCQRRPDRECDNNVIRVLRRAAKSMLALARTFERLPSADRAETDVGSLHCREPALRRRHVRNDRLQSVGHFV
jgi:hypothetical protein